MNGTPKRSWVQRNKADLPWLWWAVGVTTMFVVSWIITPLVFYQLALNVELAWASVLVAAGVVVLVAGAFFLYLPYLDPDDGNYQEITSFMVIRELLGVVFWPMIMFWGATRNNYEYRKRCLNSLLDSSRQ